LREAKPLRESADVRINDHAAGDPKSVSEDDVSCFPSDAAEREDLLHCLRDLASINLDQALTCRLDIFRFVSEKTG